MMDTPGKFSGKALAKAKKMLLSITELLDREGVVYHLEGGTLLGIVRDQALLPWDHDVDISIPSCELVKLRKLKSRIRMLGYKIHERPATSAQPFWEVGQTRVLKVRGFWISILKNLIPSLRSQRVILDIFVKYDHEGYTYWQAFDKIMRVDSRYFASYEEVEFEGRKLKVPNHYEEYLAEKYGNWRVPVKEWHAGEDEKAIFSTIE